MSIIGTRRTFLAASSALAAAGAMRAYADPGESSGASLASDAALWGFPLVSTARYLKIAQDKGAAFNRFYLNPDLATPSLHVAGPNVDTIYGYAWLDLSGEPVVLDVPDTQDRYYSIQLIDAYQNTFAYVGRRETGTTRGSFLIAAPGWRGSTPTGAKRIDSPTSLVLALTRTLVRGAGDAPAARAVQAQFKLAPLSIWPAGATAGVVQPDALNVLPQLPLPTADAGYLAELDRLVKLHPPTGREAQAFARYARLGVGERRTDAQSAALIEGARVGFGRLQSANFRDGGNGWTTNYRISKFIEDPLLRASVNSYGPGAHIAEEALYFSARADVSGAALSGASRYALEFPAGRLPPVDAFWSLTLYGPEFFLVDNPIDRYAIHDRTPDLRTDASGSLRILIQHERPTDAANWLPAPSGPFQLILRTYQPKREVLSKAWLPPAIRRI
jgi:hypothetical protein